MEPAKAIELIYAVANTVSWNAAVTLRGGSGKNSGKAQARALAAVFVALVGREPTAEELDAMGDSRVFVS